MKFYTVRKIQKSLNLWVAQNLAASALVRDFWDGRRRSQPFRQKLPRHGRAESRLNMATTRTDAPGLFQAHGTLIWYDLCYLYTFLRGDL